MGINMTANDIIKIIAAIKDTRISKLIFGDLHIEVGNIDMKDEIEYQWGSEANIAVKSSEVERSEEEMNEMVAELESRISGQQLLVEDPEEYERMFANDT